MDCRQSRYWCADVTADNWLGIHPDKDFPLDQFRAKGSFEVAPVRTDTAALAYQRVLEHVGAFLPHRDMHDERIIAEVKFGTATYGGTYGESLGIIDSQETVGGWPDLAAGQPSADTDHDGMPDAWEAQYALDPDDPADGPVDGDDDGYTNIEEFLNATDPTVYVDYNDPANNQFSWEIEQTGSQ